MVYFTAMGWILHNAGIVLYQLNGNASTTVNLWFAGSFIACLFWVSHTDAHGGTKVWQCVTAVEAVLITLHSSYNLDKW